MNNILKKYLSPSPALQKKSLDTTVNIAKENIRKAFNKAMPDKDTSTQDEYSDEYSEILKHIEALKDKKLSAQDIEFFNSMEEYYYMKTQKPEEPKKHYKEYLKYQEYLRNIRDRLWTFYLGCVLGNNYDLKKNPLKIKIDDILKVCAFIEPKFIDAKWHIDWDKYFAAYYEWGDIKLVELLEDAKKQNPDFKKEQVNIPLLRKIFDMKDEASKDVFDHILKNQLGYTLKEINAIHGYKI